MSRWSRCLIAFSSVAIMLSSGIAFAQPKPDQLAKMEKAMPEKAFVTPAMPRKVLVYTRASGFVHGSIPLGAKTWEEMGKKTGAFTVTKVTDDPAVFDDLKEFDAIVLMSTTDDFLVIKNGGDEKKKESLAKQPARKQALLDYVNNGGGLIGIHAATDAYWKNDQKWPEYTELIGGAFQEHPYGKITIKIEDPNSAVNAPFGGKEFEFSDEIYVFRMDSFNRDRLRVLLSIDVEKSKLPKQARKDDDYAVAWIRQQGKGHVFYTLLGHNDGTYLQPMILQFFLAGTQFALGDLKADATPSGKLTGSSAPSGSK